MVGRTIGKYRIVGQLGRGGMGTVYKAMDETLDREVAIKVLNPELAETDIMKRFRAEATTLAKLNHPEIATIYELFRSETDLLMVMEFVRGETLDKLSERLGPMAPDRAAYLIDKVLSALEHAHRAGIVHRDMKPANVMVTDIGGVKIMDFGIARVRGAEHMTVDGYMMGTPAYMPPEQVLGQEVDGRADLYSVGVVFYRLLTGCLPFKADTAIGMVQKQISDAPTPLSTYREGLPDWCETVLQRVLAKSPADRFQTAEEFRTAISHATGMSTSIEHTKAFANTDVETMSPPQPASLGTASPNLTGAPPATPPLPIPGPAASPSASAAVAAAASEPVTGAPIPAPPLDGATIVLRKQHFAVAGSLLGVLAIGVIVLAYAVLRRPTIVAPVADATLRATTAMPPATLDSAAAATAAPAAGTPGPAASAVASATSIGSMPGAPAATTAPGVSANASSGTSAPAHGSTEPTPTTTKPATAAIPPVRGSAANMTATDPGAARGATAKSAPARTFSQPITFDVKALVGTGNRQRERDAQLILAEGKVTVTADDNHDSLHSVQYENVASIHYSTGRDPLWKSPEGPAPVARAGGGFLGIRGDRHWVALKTKDSKDPFVVLRFANPVAARTGIKALEERVGHTSETVFDRKDAK